MIDDILVEADRDPDLATWFRFRRQYPSALTAAEIVRALHRNRFG
jgi:hypothetical protein